MLLSIWSCVLLRCRFSRQAKAVLRPKTTSARMAARTSSQEEVRSRSRILLLMAIDMYLRVTQHIILARSRTDSSAQAAASASASADPVVALEKQARTIRKKLKQCDEMRAKAQTEGKELLPEQTGDEGAIGRAKKEREGGRGEGENSC